LPRRRFTKAVRSVDVAHRATATAIAIAVALIP